MSSFGVRCILGLAALLAVGVSPAAAQQTVTITVPAGVSFVVTDVSASTSGSPAPTQVTYSSPTGFSNTDQLRISVQAGSSTFSGPGSTRIPASKVSWIAAASNGTAANGTLAFGTFTQVYISPNKLKKPDSGTVTQNWVLAPVAAAGLRSGIHTLTIVWKLEAF